MLLVTVFLLEEEQIHLLVLGQEVQEGLVEVDTLLLAQLQHLILELLEEMAAAAEVEQDELAVAVELAVLVVVELC
jgi:hypothetical protein